MSNKMTVEDNIAAFVACLRRDYDDICGAAGVKELKPGWKTIMVKAVLGRMARDKINLFEMDLMKDPKGTIKEIVIVYQIKRF